MADSSELAALAAVGVGAYAVSQSGGNPSDPSDLVSAIGELPGKAKQAGDTADDISALVGALEGFGESAPMIINAGKQSGESAGEVIDTVREYLDGRTNPPTGEDGEGNSGEEDNSGETDGGSSPTSGGGSSGGSQPSTDDRKNPLVFASEAGEGATDAVDATIDTLERTGSTWAETVKAVSGQEYTTSGTFAEGSNGGERRRIYQGSVIGGAADATAGVADDLAGSTDEAVGRATEAAKRGDWGSVASNLSGGLL